MVEQQDAVEVLQLVIQNNTVAVSWIIGDSVFSGVSILTGSYASLMLTEVSLAAPSFAVQVTGNGTGANTQVTGNGTGSSVQVTGNGTGSKTKVTGNGTGNSTLVTGNGTGGSVQVTGNGTGSSTQVTGNGTGSSTLVTGNGTGSSVLVTGNGTGSSVLVTGNGTGKEAITVTFPQGTGMSMEISLGCGLASVAIVDANSAPIIAFTDVPVLGDTGFCDGIGDGAIGSPLAAVIPGGVLSSE